MDFAPRLRLSGTIIVEEASGNANSVIKKASMKQIGEHLNQSMANEPRRCSMDYRRETPEYMYRKRGRAVAAEDIATAREVVRRMM